jgi:hypothetical protein
MRLSPEKAANLIRLLQQAIAQTYELERSASEPATEELLDDHLSGRPEATRTRNQ